MVPGLQILAAGSKEALLNLMKELRQAPNLWKNEQGFNIEYFYDTPKNDSMRVRNKGFIQDKHLLKSYNLLSPF